MQINLKRVYRTDTKKDGTKLVTKQGKPYVRVGIQTKEHGDQWLSGFDAKGWTSEWKEGDVVNVTIEETEWNGKKQLQFSEISRIDLLEARVAKLEQQLLPGMAHVQAEKVPEKEKINVNNLPF